MMLQEIVTELRNLNLDFALVTWDETTGLGGEQLHSSLDRNGLPQHPAAEAALLCQGIQRSLNLCEQSNPALAVELSVAVHDLRNRLYRLLAR